jgi:hypothetical protein
VAISVRAFLCAEFTGAAVLALWTVARFPRLGPKSLRSALVGCCAAFVLLQVVPLGVGIALRFPHGEYAAIFGWLLPAMFAVFLSFAWLMRLLAGLLGGGSGGGPGERVPA